MERSPHQYGGFAEMTASALIKRQSKTFAGEHWVRMDAGDLVPWKWRASHCSRRAAASVAQLGRS